MSENETTRLVEYSLAVRGSTLKRLETVCDGFENWRATPGSMSFADIARHLIDCDKWLFEKLDGRDIDPVHGTSGIIQINNRQEYRELLGELNRIGHERATAIGHLTEHDLSRRMVDRRFDGEVSVWWIIVRGSLDHEIHHRGQISVYLSFLMPRAANSRL